MWKLHKQYRLYGYDYSQSGYYFVTIVTKGRNHYFGLIQNRQMILSDAGKIAKSHLTKFQETSKEKNPFKNNPYVLNNAGYVIFVVEKIILPNHIHLIVGIINNQERELQTVDTIRPLVKGSLSSFINHFKGRVKRECNEKNIEFSWQLRFHDRIIRDEGEYERIAWYIRNNVVNRENDKENVSGP